MAIMAFADVSKHMKILGKLAYGYRQATSGVTYQKASLGAFMEQVAAASTTAYDNLGLFSPYVGSWRAAITGGPVAIQTLMKTLAQVYVVTSEVTGDLSAAPSSVTYRTVAARIASAMTELASNVKFTTGSAFITFMSAALSSTKAWPVSTQTSAAGGSFFNDGDFVKLAEIA